MRLSFIINESELEFMLARLGVHNGFVKDQSPVSANGMIAITVSFNNETDLNKFTLRHSTKLSRIF